MIEILIAVVIIGLLATVSVVSFNKSRIKARDARRIADTEQIQNVLELFFNSVHRYPTLTEFIPGKPLVYFNGRSTTTFMATIPTPPTPADGACDSASGVSYLYLPSETGASYTISYCLGNEVDDITPGIHCATPAGVTDGTDCGGGDDYSCPDVPVVQYDGGPYNNIGTTKVTPGPNTYYRTVKIGDQCWLRDNLNVGTMINSTLSQTNNSIVEKYCYSNDLANCNTDGGLYQWNEAMQYSTAESARGICPTGWHIPTDAEQNTLDQYLTDYGQTCDANRNLAWGCANAGTKLKPGGTSHFEGILAGYREISGSFSYYGTGLHLWSSNISEPGAWWRHLQAGSAGVMRYHNSLFYGLSVRCIHNQ